MDLNEYCIIKEYCSKRNSNCESLHRLLSYDNSSKERELQYLAILTLRYLLTYPLSTIFIIIGPHLWNTQ